MSMVKTAADTKTGKKWWEQKAAPATKEKEATHTKSLQTITFNTSSFNDEERTFVAIASTPVVDRYGDTIDQEGWDLDNFLKNPVIPWAHDYWQPPVGRVVEIGINEQGNLQFKYQAPPKGIYPFADTIWELYRNQFMFAFSVGFSSSDAEGNWESGYQFKACELLEISAVVVPANPQAVALALDKGIINEEQLKGLKSQLADGIKNVDRLIEKQATDAKDDKKDEADGEETKDATDAGTVTVDVSLTADQAKELIEAVNKAADRLENAVKAAQETEQKSAISSNLPTADKDLAWDAAAATGRVKEWASNDGEIDFGKYKKAFFWVDPENADKQGGYKLPFADVIDGNLKAVWKGVAAAMAALNGARGGLNIPDEDKAGVYAQIKKYYAKFDEEAPELKSLTTGATIDDTKGMETKAGASLSKANMEKLKACHKALTDMKAMCDEHMAVIAEMVGDMNEDGEAKATTTDQTKSVEGEEAQADKQEAEKAETAEGTNNDEQQAGDDNADGKGDGEVNSEAEKADEGADQKDAGNTSKTEEADKADDGEELVDPNDLTPEQAEKIAAVVNEELEKLKQ